MLVSTDELMEQHRYSEDERQFIEMLNQGAEAFLKNADAYRADNDLTKVVISTIVGFWLEHREATYTNYRRVSDFPLAMQGLIKQLKYLPEKKEEMPPEVAELLGRGRLNGKTNAEAQ